MKLLFSRARIDVYTRLSFNNSVLSLSQLLKLISVIDHGNSAFLFHFGFALLFEGCARRKPGGSPESSHLHPSRRPAGQSLRRDSAIMLVALHTMSVGASTLGAAREI